MVAHHQTVRRVLNSRRYLDEPPSAGEYPSTEQHHTQEVADHTSHYGALPDASHWAMLTDVGVGDSITARQISVFSR